MRRSVGSFSAIMVDAGARDESKSAAIEAAEERQHAERAAQPDWWEKSRLKKR